MSLTQEEVFEKVKKVIIEGQKKNVAQSSGNQ